jgi:hypothetical protein
MKRDLADNPIFPENGDPPPPVAMQRKLAATVTSPAINAKHAIAQWSGYRDTPFDLGLLKELEAQIAAVRAGDSGRHEEMLAGHVETLNAVFYGLMGTAFMYRGTPQQVDLVKLALRVEARAQAAIQAIADLKNPRPVAFVQQANIAHGPQQVNNNIQLFGEAQRTQNSENQPNELLERVTDERMDIQAMRPTSSIDPVMETVVTVNGPEESGG